MEGGKWWKVGPLLPYRLHMGTLYYYWVVGVLGLGSEVGAGQAVT